MEVTHFDCKPGIAIGPIHLGMTREQVLAILGTPYRSSERTPDFPIPGFTSPASDYFHETGLKVEYDAGNMVVFIEAGPIVPLIYQGISLFEYSFADVRKLFASTMQEQEFDAGIQFPEGGLSLYAPAYRDEPHLPCELISVFA
jgi:hypothetical protein